MCNYTDGRRGGGRRAYKGDCDLCGKKDIGIKSNAKIIPGKVICVGCVLKIKYREASTRPVRAKWSYESCKKEALRYLNRKDLRAENPALYSTIKKKKWDELFSHMETLGSLAERYIYVYENSDNTAYVGLTYNPEKRHESHMKRNKVLIEKKNTVTQVYKLLHGPVSKDVIGQLERDVIAEYESNGWIMLNKAKGGSLGNKDRVWNEKKVIEVISACNSKKEFYKKHEGAYQWCYRNGLLESLTSHLDSKSITPWEKDTIILTVKSCVNFKEFYTKYKGCYLKARKLGMLEELKTLFKKESDVAA